MATRETRRLLKSAGSQSKSTDLEKRNRAHPARYFIYVIVLVVVVISFVAYPVFNGRSSRGAMIFGSFHGQEIRFIPEASDDYFSQQVRLYTQRLEQEQAQGQQASSNQQSAAITYEAWREAFQGTAIHVAALYEAHHSGLVVSPNKVDVALTQSGPYIVDGKFSPDLYTAATSAERADTRRLTTEELIQTQFEQDVFFGVQRSTASVNFLKSMLSPERRLRYVVFTFDRFPTDQVAAYGKENSKLFRTMHLSRITIKSGESDAKAIWLKLQDNPDLFEELARNDSKDPFADKGGDMGVQTYNDLKADLADPSDLDKLFALKQGDVSPVFKTTAGWVIYRVNQVAKDQDFSDPDVLKSVRAYMEQFERGKIEDYLSGLGNTFKSQAVSSDFDSAAAASHLTVHTTNFFPINYGNVQSMPSIQPTDNDDSLSNAASKSDFLSTIFSLPLNTVSKPIILDSSIVVVEPTDERKASDDDTTAFAGAASTLEQTFTGQDLQSRILGPKYFVDNFDKVFFRTNPGLLPQSQ